MKKNLLRVVFTITTLLIILFIFSNSLKPSTESAKQSDEVIDSLAELFPFIENLPVRKLAHFTEFAALGFMLTMTYFSYTARFKYFYIIAVFLVAIPVIDELLQLIPEGRACMFTDMVIDFFGECFGVFSAVVLYLTAKIIIKKRSIKQVTNW